MNEFLEGDGRKNLKCWKNLDKAALQSKMKKLLLATVLATSGLKKIDNDDVYFNHVSQFPELKDMKSNHFYVKPLGQKNKLFSVGYEKNHKLCVEEVTDSELKAKNEFSEAQIQKLKRVAQGETKLLEDPHLQTYLKDVLQLNQKTTSILSRFEEIDDKADLPDFMQKRIEAYQNKKPFKENRLFSATRFADFCSADNQDKLQKLIENKNVYILICSEKNQNTIRCYSEVPEESEVLLPPESHFICLNYQKDEQGKHYFILKEVEGLSAKENAHRKVM